MPNDWKLEQWLSWIEQQHPKSIDLTLERVVKVARQLQLTQFPCPVITVAGTNGKGSCIATMQAILLAQGLNVATYISPHLLYFNERIVLNGQMVDDATLCAAFAVVREAAGDCALTFFEFTTLAALLIFKKWERGNVILLEIGLGGRLDAVNVVEPDICIITSIDFDHMDYLGNTLEAIAAEKAGIIRHNKPVIFGDTTIPQAIVNITQQKQAHLYQLGNDFNYQVTDDNQTAQTWQWQCANTLLQNLPQPKCLLNNAATALMALHCLPEKLRPNQDAIHAGLQSLQLIARRQWISGKPTHLIDVAHNPQATRKLAQVLPSDKRILAVVGMLKDKDHVESLAPLIEKVDQWFIAGLPDCPRGGTAEQLTHVLESLQCDRFESFDTVKEAYQNALEQANDEDIILVFGSFYTVAEVLLLIPDSRA